MATLRTAMRQTVTGTTKTDVTMKADLQTKIITDMKEYAQLEAEIKVLEEAKDEVKARIRARREETGSASLEFDGGWKTTDVTGQTTSVDLDKMVEDKVITQAERERYTIVKPKKSYEKITIPAEFKPVLKAKPAKEVRGSRGGGKQARLHRQ